MSKILVVPDIHGETFFDIRDIERFVKTHGNVVFLGDYWDSIGKSQAQQEFIFLQIMALKEKYPDRVVCLVGNHDVCNYDIRFNPHLLPICSGFQKQYKYRISDLMTEHQDKFQLAYEKNGYLFTHAGVTVPFMNAINMYFSFPQPFIKSSISEILNDAYKASVKEILYCGGRNGGSDPYDSCLWVRPPELEKHAIDGYIQVVGHTPSQSRFSGIKAQVFSKNIIYCDSQQLTIIDL